MNIIVEPSRELITISIFDHSILKTKKTINSDNFFTKENTYQNIQSWIHEELADFNEKESHLALFIQYGGHFFKHVETLDLSLINRFHKLMSINPSYTLFYLAFLDRILKDWLIQHKTVYFGTGFFNDLPEHEKIYASSLSNDLPVSLLRSGYHGVFHKYAGEFLSKNDKIISIVLDQKTTICGIESRKPQNISLGATPLEGIMGERSCGDLDPGIVFNLMETNNLSIYKIDDMLKNNSGFYGLTGLDYSIPNILSHYDINPKVQLAFDIYLSQIKKYIGESILVLDGLTHIVISGPYAIQLESIIYKLLKDLSFLDINLKMLPWDYFTNKPTLITNSNSQISAYVNSLSLSEIINQNLLESK